MLDVARFAQVQFGVALVVLLVLIGALAWRNVFGRPPAPDLVLPKWWRTPTLSEPWQRRARWALDGGLALTAVILAVFSMTSARPSAIDRELLLHEAVQAKYHGELGWDGLYACAWAAEHDVDGSLGIEKLRVIELGPPPTLEPTPEPERDERGHKPRPRLGKPPVDIGGKLVPARASLTKVDCRTRFDEQRWAALGADVAAIVAMDPSAKLNATFEGAGPTATPARLARQRLLFSVVPISTGSVFTLSLLAGLLTLGALALVFRAYGLRVAGVVGIAVFVEFAASPITGGVTPTGTLLVATLLAGLAAVELERWYVAGALLGFAAVDLVWPVFLALALFAKFAVDHLQGRARMRELGQLAVGFGGSAAVFMLVSATLPGGVQNWSTWLDQVGVVRMVDAAREVGLRWLFAPEGNLISAPRWVPYAVKAQHLVDRHDWILVCAVLLLAPSLLAVRRLPAVAFAAIAGVTATFVLCSTEARSFGPALPLLVLAAGVIGKHHGGSRLFVGRPPTVLAAGCLALAVGMHGLVRIHTEQAFLFNTAYSYLVTTLLLGLGVALVVLPDLKEHGDPPGAPPSIPVLNPETAAAPAFPWIAALRKRGES